MIINFHFLQHSLLEHDDLISCKAAFSQCRFEAPVHPGSVIRDKP